MIVYCGRNACEGGTGDFIPCRQVGGIGKNGRGRGRLGLGTISTAVWEGAFGTLGGTRVKEGLGTISRSEREG
jgi:hypothetical protein